jgi:hypothetical protein
MTAHSQHPQLAGELEYGSILPNGDDWRLRKFDAGMGETEYRIFKNEIFFAEFDNRKDADLVMVAMTRPARNDSDVLEQCENCIRKGLRECMYHGYPDNTIPASCSYKIGDAAVDTVYNVPTVIRQQQGDQR